MHRPCGSDRQGLIPPPGIAGFTLLECLVALAIVAVALGAALRASGASAQAAASVQDHTLATWVAQNQLNELRLAAVLPPIGETQGEAEQAGRRFVWKAVVLRTPNPLFRRVELTVSDARAQSLVTLTGFVVRPLQ